MNQRELVSTLQHLRPGAQWNLKGDTYADLEWIDVEQAKPTEEELSAAALPAKKAVVISQIKAKAAEIILARHPITKQVNAVARSVDLTEAKADRALTPEEVIEIEDLRLGRAWIRSVREASNLKEAEALALPDYQAVIKYDLTTGWPE